MNDTIGIFYELPDGRIAKSYAWNGQESIVKYYFNDDAGGHIVSEAEWASWKPRRDLKDFPDSNELIPPYDFNSLWKMDHISDLRRTIQQGHLDLGESHSAIDENELLIEIDTPANNSD